MKIQKVILIILIVFSGVFYYNLTEKVPEKEAVIISRVIDGDTIETGTGQKIRLKGINTPESSMEFYEESKCFLSERLLNKTVKIESYGFDKYGRILAHVFLNKEHINEEILQKGLATLYYYEKDSHYGSLGKAEEFARLNEIGIWKESKNSHCLELIELNYFEGGERCSNKEVLEIENSCDFDIKLTLKDDATHIYDETILSNSVFTKNFSCIWNDDGDSLYAWDDEGLVLFWRYP